MARRMIGAVAARLVEGIDGKTKRRCPLDVLEALAGKTPEIRARREQVNDRSVCPCGRGQVAEGLRGLA